MISFEKTQLYLQPIRSSHISNLPDARNLFSYPQKHSHYQPLPTEYSDSNCPFDFGQFVFTAASVPTHIVPREIKRKLVAFERPFHFAWRLRRIRNEGLKFLELCKSETHKPFSDSFSHRVVGVGSPVVLHFVENGEFSLVRMSVGSIRNLGLTKEKSIRSSNLELLKAFELLRSKL